MSVNRSLELLLDTMLGSYKYADLDELEAAKRTVLDEARAHIICPSRSLNPYALLGHELYAIYTQRRNPEMLDSAILLYAMGLARHYEFSRLKKELPRLDPKLPGVKRLTQQQALLSSLYLEREGRFDLAARLWEKRGEYRMAKAYKTIAELKTEVNEQLPVQ